MTKRTWDFATRASVDHGENLTLEVAKLDDPLTPRRHHLVQDEGELLIRLSLDPAASQAVQGYLEAELGDEVVTRLLGDAVSEGTCLLKPFDH